MLFDKVMIGVSLANLAVIGMLSFVFVNLVTIPLVSPENGLYTTERKPELVWGGMQGEYVIFLDEDPGFGTPITKEVSGNSYRLGEDLGFGTYHWKVMSGLVASEIREFTVGSSVVLARKEKEVSNVGNVDLLIHRLTGAFILGVNKSLEIGEDEDVKGEQV
ncbi:MAG: hypothetical protein JSV39_04700 [Candidatus Aenigmatarchaeota archaeon]|nr:MAG: hypothetical protein JSV39_04700 [Candidatus Aenigmarchaeota archaeon]